MRKFISGLIIGMMLSISAVYAAGSFTAFEASFPVFVNGERFISDKPIVTIGGTTYMPLKAIGDALGVKVDWNNDRKRVEVGETKAAEKQIIEFTNIVVKNEYGMTKVEGEAKNNDIIAHSIILRVSFYDSNDNLLGSASGAVAQISPGSVKVFTAIAAEDYKKATYYKVQIDTLL
jgi:hypothetical protein